MRLKNFLFVVTDIEVSKQFYKELFGMQVLRDFGENVILSEGLVLQELRSWEQLINQQVTIGNASELYFEEYDFDKFLNKIADQNVEKLGDIRVNSWGKRVVQVLDPDGHIIEVAES